MTRIIVNLVESDKDDKGQAYIYIYEDGCGVEPHEPFEEFQTLREAIRHNRYATIMRYPGTVDMW